MYKHKDGYFTPAKSVVAPWRGVLIIILSIFISDDTLLFGHTQSIAMVCAKILVNFIVLFFSARALKLDNSIGFLAVFFIMVICSVAANTDINLNYGYLAFMMLVAYAFTGYISFSLYAKVYVDTILWLSCVCVLYWLLRDFFVGRVPVVSNGIGVPASTIFFCSSYGSGGRAMSIFREPGIYAMYLAVALIFELIFLKRKGFLRTSILCGAMFLTFSSAGILISIPIFVTWLFKQGGRSMGMFIKAALLVGVCVLLVLFNDSIQHNTIDRNFSEEALEANPRIVSQIVPLSIWLAHPFTGCGISNFLGEWEQRTFELYGVLLGEGSSTSGLANGLAKYGVLWLLVPVLLFFLSRKLASGDKLCGGFLVLSFVGMFMSQNMPYSIFFWVLVFYGARAYAEKIELLPKKRMAS